jgi:predicted thioesterase
MPVASGLSAEIVHLVDEADTALAMRSGEVPVLATPRVVALCEEAAMAALRGALGEGQTSVGARLEITHLAPTRVGSKVRAEATLEKVEGRRLVFTVSVSDDYGLVAAGKITRVVVNVKQFMEKAR